ncbi:MAG TPA: tripartite tricarboxylate transporter substrate binding protein [Syntrophorhabdales bacterium]|nr:tripartite tricarboxylate transporter substrate binding protein [Syntrophorhabdales bacterium]
MKVKILWIVLIATVLGIRFNTVGYGQEKYPSKPIQIVVPFGAGGSSDLFFRSLTDELSKMMKVPVTVVDRTGASGLVGADFVANSKNDGYTLLGTSSAPITIAPAIDPKDARELDPLALLAYQANLIATRNESEFRTLDDLVEYAKKKPGALTCGTSGIQSEPYFALELFKAAAKIDLRHVPISSSREGITNTLGGHIDFWFGSLSTSQSLMKAGRIRGLAVCTERRLESFPSIPTFAEKNYPQVNVNLIITLLGPRGLPQAVIKTWEDVLKAVLANPEVAASSKRLNYDIDLQVGTEKLRAYFKGEVERFSKIAKQTGLRK